MKNNIKALLLHLIMVIISLIFTYVFVATGPTLGRYTTHIIWRLLLVLIFIVGYIFLGTQLDITNDSKYDIWVGCIIAMIGIVLWVYTFRLTGRNFLKAPKELSEYWILFNIYYAPFTIVDFLLGIPQIPLLCGLNIIYPSLLLWCGMRLKRKEAKKAMHQ